MEWAVWRALEAAGYDHINRGSASKGIDIIAGRFSDDIRLVIECRTTSYMNPHEREWLTKIAEHWNASACLTVSDDVEWRVADINDGTVFVAFPLDEAK